MTVKRALVVVSAALVCLGTATLALRAGLQWRAARSLQITSPSGIFERGFVEVSGSPQWLEIRGRDRTNPVILLVHGGPGFAMSPFARTFQPWEASFTMVQWDQRDAGRTFSRNGPQPISIEQVARDGVQVAEHVRRRLPDARIILLGHSWGSAVGLRMVQDRPDLFAAFVGTGQMSSKSEQEALSYSRVLERLRETNNRAGVEELTRSGPPPYKDMAGLLVERKWLAVVDTPAEQALFRNMAPQLIAAPGMSLGQVRDYLSAPKVAQAKSFEDVARFEARRLGPTFETPIFVFAGDDDLYTPMEPTARYLRGIEAPTKDLVVLKGGHNVLLTSPDAFLDALRTRVLPRVAAGAPAQ